MKKVNPELQEILSHPDFPIYNYAGISKMLLPDLQAEKIHGVKHNRITDEETVSKVIGAFKLILKIKRLAHLISIEKMHKIIDKMISEKEKILTKKMNYEFNTEKIY